MINPRGGLASLLNLLLLFSLLVVVQSESPVDDDQVAGPVVKTRPEKDEVKEDADGSPAPAPGPANATDLEKKKTIAQMLDEALEQEFPEEKTEKIGKNYNETAQQEDVSSSLNTRVCLILLVSNEGLILRGSLQLCKTWIALGVFVLEKHPNAPSPFKPNDYMQPKPAFVSCRRASLR